MSLQWLMMMILYHSGNNVITMANDDDFISFK